MSARQTHHMGTCALGIGLIGTLENECVNVYSLTTVCFTPLGCSGPHARYRGKEASRQQPVGGERKPAGGSQQATASRRHARGGSQQATASRREQEVNISKVVKITCTDGSFESSNFSISQTFKLSNSQTFKLSNFQIFRVSSRFQTFKLLHA